MSAKLLTALEQARDNYGEGCAEAKLVLLRRLGPLHLRTAGAVMRLHEALCFLRAYPDNAEVLTLVERMLARFNRRADLGQHRARLADSGIAGTVIRYRFYWSTACWFVRRWPGRLRLDRDDAEAGERIGAALPLLLTVAEAAALRQVDLPGFASTDRVRARAGRGASDAGFWVRLIASMPGDTFTRQNFHDRIDASYELRPGLDTPSRTHAWHPGAPVAFQTSPLDRSRPDLRAEIVRSPLAVRPVSEREGARVIELARGAMVTRARDLDAFAYGDPRDVRIVDDGAGFGFAVIGTVPERRTLIPAIYGYVGLKNGVPVSYGEVFAVGRFASITFNVFETFRGGEAARIFGRVLAMAHQLFGAASFSLEPYQVGRDNDEAIASGAWWFYYKLGFRPLEAGPRRVLREELRQMKKNRSHRSSAANLRKLAEGPMLFDLDPGLRPALPPMAGVGLRVVDLLAVRAGTHGERERAIGECRDEAMRLTGTASLSGCTRDERLAWERWSTLLCTIPRVAQWSLAERRALGAIVMAKAGRRESDYLALLSAHPKLLRALCPSPRRRPGPN
ncbi:MAG: hypothetical protein ABI831_12310 [Betaproteobacteria bacterium]